jgi:hypothetical protein
MHCIRIMYKVLVVGLILIATAIPSFQQIKSKNLVSLGLVLQELDYLKRFFIKVKMIKVYRFAPCNKSSMIEFNTSTLRVTGGINELNIVGFVNFTKDVPSPIKVRRTENQFVYTLNKLLLINRCY